MTAGRLAIMVGAFVAVAALAGCRSEQETAPPQIPTISFQVTDSEITPSNPTVDEAGEVFLQIRNDGRMPHVLAVEGPGGEMKTDPIRPGAGATLRVPLTEPGTYRVYCPLPAGNDEDGMEARITVEEG